MELAALIVAAVGLLAALLALGRTSSFSGRIEEAQRDSKRRAENVAEELERALNTQRELLALVAAGAPLTRDMILEGRLWSDVDGATAKKLVDDGARLLDVRTPSETSGGIIPGAIMIPIDALEARVGELPNDARPWVIYCAAGSRSAAACEFLSHQGHSGLHNLSAGIGAWNGILARPA